MKPRAALAQIRPGEIFAGYEIEGLVGRGGMGIVYRARDPALERTVALKLIAGELTADARFRERFLRESKFAASLEHPHVLPVYAAGEAEGVLFLATRFVDGEDLRALLARRGPLLAEEAVHLLGQVAGALDAAHVRGLVHRDVKPGNILLDSSGEAYLADFGLTKRVTSESAFTHTGELVGTLDYLAPEQIHGGLIDGRCDLYALACLLYECLSGEAPFARESEAQVLWAHVQEPPPRLTTRRADLPAAIDQVLARALAKAPEQRFGTCRELVEAARSALGLGGRHRAEAEVVAPRTPGAFVGRERELAELLGGLDDAIAGRGRLFLLAGEPGIGKSRLAEEVVARAPARGARVLVGRAWEAGGAPAYWPWVQALRPLLRDLDPATLPPRLGHAASHVAQLFPELLERMPELESSPALEEAGARFLLFDALASLLGETARGRPLLLVLDDLHAADAPSLLLLQFLAQGLAESSILIVGAYRDVDPTPREPLTSALAELVREPVTSRIFLRGLGEPEVVAYIEATAGRSAAEALVAAIHAETEGNPLFVGELVRLLAAEGALDRHEAQLEIPPSVREVIDRRLAALPEPTRRVLGLASMLGREFDLRVLEFVSGIDSEELSDALEHAVGARTVGEVPGATGRLRFAHALIREVLYDELGPVRRPQLHRQLGEALEHLYATDREPHLAELAHHFLAAAPGRDPKALDYARRAAERAASLLAFEEAARLYRLALEICPTDDECCDLLLALGDAHAKAGEMPSARETFLRAAELARRAGTPERLARAALGYGGRLVWTLPEDKRLVPLLEEALGALGERGGALRARLLARLACALSGTGSAEPSASLSLEAVELARKLEDRAALVWALVARRVVLWGPDNMDELLALSNEIVVVAEEVGEWEQAVNAHTLRLELLLTLGDVAGVRTDLEAAARLAEELRLPAQLWHVAVHQAELALFEGRFADAEELVEQALRFGERAHGAHAIECGVTQRFPLRLEQGRLEEIRPALEQLAAENADTPLFLCLLARLECEQVREAEARTIFEALAQDAFAGIPRDSDWLLTAALLAETAVFLTDAARAATLYELLLPYAALNVGAAHRFTTGSASRYLGLLASALSRFDEAARHFEDAMAMNERIGARPWLAYAQDAYARMLLVRAAPGDRERADELLARCLATCDELGMRGLQVKAMGLG